MSVLTRRGFLRTSGLGLGVKANRRGPGDPAVGAVTAMLKTIPDETFADLAAYYGRLR